MSKYIERFSEDSFNFENSIVSSGRFSFQKDAVKKIAPEVMKKIELKTTDSLLDIGCNCGDVTIPLSFMCDKVTVVDGPGPIARIKRRTSDYNKFTYVEGDFLEVDIQEKFDCIIAIGVLLYVNPFEKKVEFIQKALDMLKPGGRLLISDIVNNDRKKRFANSEKGKEVDQAYREKFQLFTEEDVAISKHKFEGEFLNDVQLMEVLLKFRERGYETYLLPQSPELPFGYTRDDILIKKW